jgi:hypothetical protein
MGTRCSLRNARLYVVYRPSASLSATVWARVEVKFRATRQLLPFYSYHGQLPTFTILPAWFSKNPEPAVGRSFPAERLGISLTRRLPTPPDRPSHHDRPGPLSFFKHPSSA